MRPPILPLLALAFLPTFSATRDGDPPLRVTSEQLGGETRILSHISTDKPIYRGGETVFVRGVMLDASHHRPMATIPWVQVEVLGPKGEVVQQGGTQGADGVVSFTWAVPEGQAGGQYRLRMSGAGLVPGERGFEVRAFRAPRIKSQIVFLRDGYGAGDQVSATLQATRAEGGAPVGAKVTLVATVDGREVAHVSAGVIDSLGRASATFSLPAIIERGEGTLALIIEDGGVVETATKTIPILLNVVDLSVFPEGGELVAGLPTRLYFEARTPADKPADIAGVIETTGGVFVAAFKTEHEGRGRVRVTPVAGESYRVRITEPTGINKTHALPEVVEDGGVIAAFSDVAEAGKTLRLRVAATRRGTYDVTVSQHETDIAHARVSLASGELRPLALKLPDEADGVLRVTLWNEEGFPISERLVFRSPADVVNVALTFDRLRYIPAGSVVLRVKTTNADGLPVPAMVGLTVSDDSVRELLETRDQPPQLPVQVLFENDVRELADAAVYLNPRDPKAPRAVDLLLGTQGWRRFAYVTAPRSFIDTHGDMGRRALALVESASPDFVTEADSEGGVIGGVIGGVMDFLGLDARGQKEDAQAMAFAPRPMAPASVVALRDDKLRAAEGPVNEAVDQPVMAWREKKHEHADKDEEAQNRQEIMAAPGRRVREVAGMAKRAQVMPLREYAHVVRPDRKANARVDFTDTVYWNAGLKTNEEGEASVTFTLSDSITSFRVLGDAFTEDGVLGSATSLVESVKPFYIEPKLPLEVTYGDVVRLPVTAINGTFDRLLGSMTATGPDALGLGTMPHFSLAGGERLRSLLEMRIGQQAGTFDLTIAGSAGSFNDSVTRSLRVMPLGFPVAQSFGGTLQPGTPISQSIDIPADVVPFSVRADIKIFPSSLGKLSSALERLIQEPYGCFEQTSSTTYPLIMAAQYFETHQGVDPALITRSQEMLTKGYERLTGFETKSNGYEWFGEAPGHEALSAFGLMEFSDMSKVRTVDSAMLARTREWVLSTRDGKGGFKRERRALHTWIEDVDSSNAYILWTLLETGESAKSLTLEIDALAKAARASKNSYVHALAANVAQLAGRSSEAAEFVTLLAKNQNVGGWLDGATASIVGSSGEALQIEATSLATLAWLRSPAHAANVEKSMQWLAESCQGGRYGSTQSTVLALRAIVAYDAAHSSPRAAGSIIVTVDGKPVGTPVVFDEKTDGALILPDIAPFLLAGKHRIGLVMDGGSEMPFAVEITLNRQRPDSSSACPLALSVNLSTDRLVEGEITDATALITNRTSDALPMAIAIVGLPGGLEPRHEQLKELVRSKSVAAYEVIGREVVLYFRSMEPNAVKRVPISLVAAIPGTYTGPASRAYLYYGDEDKTWEPGFKVEIVAR